MKKGIEMAVKVIIAWVGPLCMKSVGSMNCRIKSTSGIIDTTRSMDMFRLVLRILEEPFPSRYPSAK